MIGAIIGDIVGSRFEWNNHRSKDFDLLPHSCFFTDDSVMSLAICDAFLRINNDFSKLSEQVVKSMQNIGRQYPDSGYGGAFFNWCFRIIRNLTIVMVMARQCASVAVLM